MNFIQKQKELCSIFSRINILYRKLAKKYNISYNEMMILYILKEKVPCTQKNIVYDWELPKQTVNTIIKNLEKKGFINFEFTTNQKEKIIHLTESGREFVIGIIEDVENMERTAYDKIGEEKCSIVLDIVKEYYKYLEEEFDKK